MNEAKSENSINTIKTNSEFSFKLFFYLHNEEWREQVLFELTTADYFQVSEVRQICELILISLDVEITGDFFESWKHFQAIWMNLNESWAEWEVRVDLLVAAEGLIENL